MGCNQSKSATVENPVAANHVKAPTPSPNQQQKQQQHEDPTLTKNSSSEQSKEPAKVEQPPSNTPPAPSPSEEVAVICEDSNPSSPKMELVLSPTASANNGAKPKQDEVTAKVSSESESPSNSSRTNTPRRRRRKSTSSGVEAMQEAAKELEEEQQQQKPAKLQPVKKKEVEEKEAAADEKAALKEVKKEEPAPDAQKKEEPAAPAADEKEEEPASEKAVHQDIKSSEEADNSNNDKMPETTKKCAGCDTVESSPGSFKLCAKCKDVRYCSRDCQKAHWKIHKFECGKGLDVSSSHLNASQGNLTNTTTITTQDKPVETQKASNEDAAKELEERLESIRNDDHQASAENKETKVDSSSRKNADAVVEDPVDAARKQAEGENNENVAPSTSKDDKNGQGAETAKKELRKCEGCSAVEGTRGEFKHCAKCNVSVYCSRPCQKSHWKAHKKVCCKKDQKAPTESNKLAVAAN